MRNITHIFIVLALILGFANHADALTVSPVKIEVTGDPGQTLVGEIEVFNEQDSTKTFYSSFENFEPRGDSGAPYFIGAADGLATWMSSQESFSVDAGERIKIPYSIEIPQSADAGGYFAAIFFGSQPTKSKDPSQVTIGGKIGVLVLLRVSGDIKTEGGLIDFQTEGGKRFYSSLPISITYRVNNAGGDRIVPKGDIRIKNTFALTSAKFSANERDGSVLPGSARKFSVIWSPENAANTVDSADEASNASTTGFFASAARQFKDFHFGWYTARLNITWEGADKVQDSFHFFIIPWQALIIILLIGSVVGYVIMFALKKYNRWIVSQAMNAKQQ